MQNRSRGAKLHTVPSEYLFKKYQCVMQLFKVDCDSYTICSIGLAFSTNSKNKAACRAKVVVSHDWLFCKALHKLHVQNSFPSFGVKPHRFLIVNLLKKSSNLIHSNIYAKTDFSLISQVTAFSYVYTCVQTFNAFFMLKMSAPMLARSMPCFLIT